MQIHFDEAYLPSKVLNVRNEDVARLWKLVEMIECSISDMNLEG